MQNVSLDNLMELLPPEQKLKAYQAVLDALKAPETPAPAKEAPATTMREDFMKRMQDANKPAPVLTPEQNKFFGDIVKEIM